MYSDWVVDLDPISSVVASDPVIACNWLSWLGLYPSPSNLTCHLEQTPVIASLFYIYVGVHIFAFCEFRPTCCHMFYLIHQSVGELKLCCPEIWVLFNVLYITMLWFNGFLFTMCHQAFICDTCFHIYDHFFFSARASYWTPWFDHELVDGWQTHSGHWAHGQHDRNPETQQGRGQKTT